MMQQAFIMLKIRIVKKIIYGSGSVVHLEYKNIGKAYFKAFPG